MSKKTDKEKRILDAMETLLLRGEGLTCSVSQIAKTAGIGKGSIYYYFASKEEIADALITRTYAGFIDRCQAVLTAPINALDKLKLLFRTYYSQSVDRTLDEYLHLPQNADMHQKSLAHIVLTMSPILAEILEQGAKEGALTCHTPAEYAQIIVTVLAFLFDYGIFPQRATDTQSKLKAFAEMLETSLSIEQGFFSFLYEPIL